MPIYKKEKNFYNEDENYLPLGGKAMSPKKEISAVSGGNQQIADWTFEKSVQMFCHDTVFRNVTFCKDVTVTRKNITKRERITFIGCRFEGETFVIPAGTENVLFADCQFARGATLSAEGVRNLVLVKNRLYNTRVSSSRNVYVCENEIAGDLTLTGNRFLLGNGNTLAGRLITEENEAVNGDSLTDITARPSAGANEDLLPHPDKDQFVGMERILTVMDGTGETYPDLYAYLLATAHDGGVVYVPPGAYRVDHDLTLKGLKNLTVYAYGVYAEMAAGEGCHRLGTHLTLHGTENVTLKGLAVGYADQACGQIYILEKLGNVCIRATTGAGMIAEFGVTDPTYYNTKWVSWHRLSRGERYAYRDTGFKTVEKQADGTLLLQLNEDIYPQVSVGDALTCRAVKGASSIRTLSTAGTLLEDVSVYGSSGGLCFLEEGNLGSMTYHRVADLSCSGNVIDKETYDRFAALGAKYGVDFGISVDEWGNCRGTPALIGSIDATHVAACAGGSRVISCRFEDMCDDGTNQKSRHGRLSELIDNGDGTVTVVYKGNLPETKVDRKAELTAAGFPKPFRVGDRLHIYTSAGQTVCDTAVLSASRVRDSITSTFNGLPIERQEVVVAKDAIRYAALAGYDLSDDHYSPAQKVLVDNMSRTSNGFYIENTLVRGTRSRGLLIKASDGVVKNCTFRDNAKCGVAVIYEIYWGESGVSENVAIENCLFDNTSYSTSKQVRYRHAPIVVAGISEGRLEEDYLAYKNIRITGNKFVNRNLHVNPYAIYVQAARDILIADNDFGTEGEALCLNGAMNVEYKGNACALPVEQAITGEPYKNLFGTDVDGILPRDKF